MRADRPRLWLVIGIETLVLIALALWILSRLDRLLEPVALLVGAVIVVVGDIATALIMQHFAPTSIVVEPGEQTGRLARAVGDFDARGCGLVSMRGERWQARSAGPQPIRDGARVRVCGRDGLTLVVDVLE